MSLIVDGTTGVTFNDSSLQGAAASPYVLKNRIINGDMRIDQRNAGASVTPSGGNYTLDRWMFELAQSSKLTCQQNAGAVTPPTGFTNYLGITSSSAYTSLTNDYFWVVQKIEGYNVADLAFGTASAKTITLSFWIYSSLTGTFSGALGNSANNRTFPFIYTISSANTWTYITVSIAGDTSGTWLTTTGAGLNIYFNLGTGSGRQSPAGQYGSWVTPSNANADYRGGVAGTVSLIGTNGATWYFTGVQLEIGTSATPFERRMYGQELANCQRYFAKSYTTSTTPGTNTNNGSCRMVSTGGAGIVNFDYPVEMRAEPTVTPYSVAGTSGVFGSDAGNWTPTIFTSTRHFTGYGAVTSGNYTYGHYIAAAEL